MFSREGSDRSDAQNRRVAGYLAFVAGFVNSCGFVLIGTFTSHVTGNVGRMANDAATGQYAAAAAALTMVLAFFAGAFCASVTIESRLLGGAVSRSYALALAMEALLLVLFTLCSYAFTSAHPRVRDAEAALLCGAMGMQNALVTRLSGAVVRTTHLTGVITDLGIECARWFRAKRPAIPKLMLLATIMAGFLCGAIFGVASAIHLGHAAMLIAVAAVGACALYAGWNERTRGSTVARPDAK
jgi:uncharacterized membrane protein YoaK (UPF0700 family)